MTAAPRDTDIFRPGDLLNNTYRIEGVLGRGGISEVYRARSEISGRVCALKVLNREFAANEAFLVLITREEEIQDIRHDSIVRYGGCQKTPEGHVYLIMDFVDGVALDHRMAKGPVPMRDLLVIGARIGEGLEAAHARNIIHRDLSPDNIILRADDPGQAVIIDFGIAKDATPGAATIVGGKFAGKYAYAAPEQFRGNTDPRSDIYSTGALLLAAFRGQEPEVSNYPADVIEYKAKPLDTQDVPQPLRRLLDQMVIPDVEARFQTATEMRRAFSDAIDGLTIINPPPPVKPGRTPARRGLLAALVLVLSAGLGTVFFGSTQGWFLPKVEQFVLLAQDLGEGPPTLTGFAPSASVQDELHALVAAEGGAHDLSLARHEDLHPEWGTAISNILDVALDLDTFSLSVEDHDIHLTGQSDSPDHRAEIETRLAALPLPDTFTLSTEIALPNNRLFAEAVAPVLADRATCGPLRALNLPPEGLPADRPLRIEGRIQDDGDRLLLRDELSKRVGDHPVQLDLTELNPALCLLFRNLPPLAESGVEISYRFGRTSQVNTSDRFYPGENPVIDLILPAGVTQGVLNLIFVGADGSVARLLPNATRTRNDVPSLRAGIQGRADIRVTYSSEEAKGTNRLTIWIEPESAGTGLLLLLHADAPVLAAPVRRQETVQALVAAIKSAAQSQSGTLLAMRTRYLITQSN